MHISEVFYLMVSPDLVLTGLLAVLGLAGTGAGFLYRRDSKQQEDIEENTEAISDLDRGFVRVTTRLFGHPNDESDRGAVPKRAAQIERAEEELDSLSDEVQTVKEQAEENGDAIDHLEERVNDHARVTREALERIEECLSDGEVLDGDSDVIPDGGEGDGD